MQILILVLCPAVQEVLRWVVGWESTWVLPWARRIGENVNLVSEEALASSRSGPARSGVEHLQREDSCD